MNYYYDVEQLREGAVVDPNLHFASSASCAEDTAREPVARSALQA